MTVAVMGGGSWGTAFAMIVADAGNDVVLWARDRDVVESINSTHENARYHPGIGLPQTIVAVGDASLALRDADVVVLAIPSQSLRANLGGWAPQVRADAVLVSLMKGIELGTMSRMSEVIREVAGLGPSRVAVISGPNLAREIAMRQPAASTIACADADVAERLAERFNAPYFRPYWTTDVIGTEFGGAVKNVIALANGIVVGLGIGENTQAALITRGLAEIARLGTALGAHPLTFVGLAGVGDLVATCSSPLSRNRSFGELLGRGFSTAEAMEKSTQTCEAVKSCQPILDLATRHGVEMPITEQVVAVVHGGADPRDAVTQLMSRTTKGELGSD